MRYRIDPLTQLVEVVFDRTAFRLGETDPEAPKVWKKYGLTAWCYWRFCVMLRRTDCSALKSPSSIRTYIRGCDISERELLERLERHKYWPDLLGRDHNVQVHQIKPG
jgi:hypothetical protein